MAKNIIITGCSSGIGLCMAEGLKKRGYTIFATARKVEDVEKLRKQGFQAVQLDLANSASIESAILEIKQLSSEPIYALVNNGAYGQPGAVEDLSRHALRQQFETNLFGTHELTTKLIPEMREQGEGRIIQISSVLGFVAMKYRGAYNASKFALEGLSDTMRMELKGSGVYVSSVQPGPITSRFRPNALAAYEREIDAENSAHKEIYKDLAAKLAKKEAVVPFTLGPEAVLEKVIHALESKKPKRNYYVTVPTYLFAYLKRILPATWLDNIVSKY